MNTAGLGTQGGPEEASELKTLLAQWRRREEAAFGPGPGPAGGVQPLPLDQRTVAIEGLRRLLLQNDCLQELPAAATLFDAFAAKALATENTDGTVRLGPEALVHGATLTAVVRLALKLHSCEALGFNRNCCREDDGGLTAHRELAVVVALGGCLALPSPWQWAAAVLSRAKALAMLPSAAATVARHVAAWATLFMLRVASRPGLLPSALALGACALGLVSSGTMPAEELRPQDVVPEAWAAGLMAQLELHVVAAEPAFSAAELAEAADMTEEELRVQAYAAASELQMVLVQAAMARA